MKRQTKNILLVSAVIVLTGVGCTLIGRATADGFDSKKIGPEVTLLTENVQESKAIVDGDDVKVRGAFLDGEEKTQYTYTLDVDGREKFDTTNISLNSTITNFNSIDITIVGYGDSVDTIDISMLASVKDTVTCKASVSMFSYGKKTVVTSLDDYHYDANFSHSGQIKIHIESKDEKSSFSLDKIVINKAKPVKEDTSSTALNTVI